MEVDKPDREPDLVLPRENGVSRVLIWIEECVFGIDDYSNCHNHVESGGKHYETVNDYLEYCSNRKDTPNRSAIAAVYILEKELELETETIFIQEKQTKVYV